MQKWAHFISFKFKVGKEAKIQNLYNQVPHLPQNTILDSDKSTRKRHKQVSQEVNRFPPGDHKAAKTVMA